jgi:hypothetical protein
VLSVLAAGLVYVQIVFGAFLTHAGFVTLHLAGAALVYVFVPIVTARLRRTGDSVAIALARTMLVLLGVQLLLGAGAFVVRFTSVALPGEQATGLALPVAHRLVASLLLGAATIVAVRVAAGREVASDSSMAVAVSEAR